MDQSTYILSTIFEELGEEADEEMCEIIRNFVENWLPATEKQIQEAFVNKDWPLLQSIIHSVKGCAGGFGYMVMTDLSKEIEIAIKVEEYDLAQELLEGFNHMCKSIYAGFKVSRE